MENAMSEEVVVSEVSAARIREDVERIVRELPYRAAGSENGRRMAEYSRAGLQRAGLPDAVIHELPAIVSFPRHAEFRVESPIEMAIQANTLGHSLVTPEDGITGELVYVGSGAYSDYEGRDLRGKIILTELSYAPARHEKQRIAGQMGAIGAVMMNWGGPDNTAVPFGSVKPVWGNPTPENVKTQMPTIPCIGIARTVGLKLKDMCAAGPVRVWFRTHVENGWRPVQITVGRMPAPATSPEASDFVLVGGHQDSWFGEAATDNAAGNACKLELARVFSRHRDKLRRGLMFGFWTAHETGTMAGSAWFCDRHWDELRRHCVAYLQIDQPAIVGTTEWNTASNAELKVFHSEIEARLLDCPVRWHRAVKNGDTSFFGIGIPMLQGEGAYTAEELKQTALAAFGWWHHSIENRLDKLDWTAMQTHIRIYAAYLWRLCTEPVLPFRFTPVADELIARLGELSEAGRSIGLSATLEPARHLREQTVALDKTADTEAERFRGGAGSETAALLLNGAMKRLSRILVPLQSTAIGTYGHDPYGYTPQTTVIPCLYDVPRLARTPDGPDRWMLETSLVRARNKVADALNDAADIISVVLARLK
jgi:hypothetical protein